MKVHLTGKLTYIKAVGGELEMGISDEDTGKEVSLRTKDDYIFKEGDKLDIDGKYDDVMKLVINAKVRRYFPSNGGWSEWNFAKWLIAQGYGIVGSRFSYGGKILEVKDMYVRMGDYAADIYSKSITPSCMIRISENMRLLNKQGA